jgi:hypothetical protein
MTVYSLLIASAALCALCALIAFVLMTIDVDKRGLKTAWPLIGIYFFRNLDFYRKDTLSASGRVGPLFYLFIVPINAAWILALLALAFQ